MPLRSWPTAARLSGGSMTRPRGRFYKRLPKLLGDEANSREIGVCTLARNLHGSRREEME